MFIVKLYYYGVSKVSLTAVTGYQGSAKTDPSPCDCTDPVMVVTNRTTMQTNGRSGNKSPATANDEWKRINETRSLLAQGLTRTKEGDRKEAMDSVAAATRRLGDRRWPEEHPSGRVLELANSAINQIMVNECADARRLLREALQFLEAVEEEVSDR